MTASMCQVCVDVIGNNIVVAVVIVAVYMAGAFFIASAFDRTEDRADYLEPGKYEGARFIAAALWPFAIPKLVVSWRRSRRKARESPPE